MEGDTDSTAENELKKAMGKSAIKRKFKKKKGNLVTIHVAIKRAHRRVQAAAVRSPVLVSELENLLHIHLTTVNFNFSRYFNKPQNIAPPRQYVQRRR